MWKKSLIISICSLFAIAAGCSKDEAPSWDDGDKCSISDMDNDNGAQCYKNKLYGCQNGKIVTTVCSKNCEVTNNKAHCSDQGIVDFTSTTTHPEPGNRPGEEETKIPNVGDPCGKYTEEGACIFKENRILFCGENNTIEEQKCANGCMYDDEQYAVCIESCNGETAKGSCKDNALAYCYNDGTSETLVSYSCGTDVCQISSDESGNIQYACIEPGSTDACGIYIDNDACSNKVITYCTSDYELVQEECKNGCMYDDDLYAMCIEPCGDITEVGKCDGNVLKYCYVNKDNEKSLVTRNCKEDKLVCGKSKSSGQYECLKSSEVDPDTPMCGTVTKKGKCKDEHTVTWCNDDNELQVASCGADKCALDDEGYAGCENTTPCGDITGAGICDGTNTLKYCNDRNILITKKCDNGCVKPGDDADADCYTPCGEVPAEGTCDDDRYLSYCGYYGLVEQDCGEINCIKGHDDDGDFYYCWSPESPRSLMPNMSMKNRNQLRASNRITDRKR